MIKNQYYKACVFFIKENKIKKVYRLGLLLLLIIFIPFYHIEADEVKNRENDSVQIYKPEKVYRWDTVRCLTHKAPDKWRYKKLEGEYYYDGWIYIEKFLYIDDNTGLGVFRYGGYVNRYPKNMIMNTVVDK